jgi:hypothetical protein
MTHVRIGAAIHAPIHGGRRLGTSILPVSAQAVLELVVSP